ncbi:MAG TPA: AraC family transcriptional regulator, partial [Lachnospiraceae bacterium]
ISSYSMDTRQGNGTCRVHKIQEYGAIVMLDYDLKEDSRVSLSYDGFIFIGYYRQISATKKEGFQTRNLLSNSIYSSIDKKENTIFTPKGTHIRGIFIIILPQYYDVYIKQRFPYEDLNFHAIMNTIHEMRYFPELTSIFLQLEHHRSNDIAGALFLESKFTEIFSLIIKKAFEIMKNEKKSFIKEDDKKAIEKLCVYIEKNLSKNLSLQELSSLCCMSTAKLKYTFKHIHNCSISQYRMEVRIREAKRLLSETELCIAQISALVGYKHTGAMIEAFKKTLGITPKEYRLISR